MNRRTLLLASAAGLAAIVLGGTVLPAVGSLLGAWRLGSVGWRLLHVAGSGRFVLLPGAKDVYRLDLWWRPVPLVVLPVTAMLIKEGGSRGQSSGWVLIDAGPPDNWSQAYAGQLVQAVQETTAKGGRLKAILLTHGHLDHIGALPQLLQAYSGVPVIIHSREAPFLQGQVDYVPPNSCLQRALQMLGVLPSSFVKLPESRLTSLQGDEGGDLRQYGISSLSWLPTPGHTPGHISFLHGPSGALLAGDAVFNMLPSFGWASGIEALVTRPLGWVSGSVARMALALMRMTLGRLWGGKWPAASATLSVLGLGPLPTKAVVPTSSVSQELGTYRVTRLLPGLTVRISPSIVCIGPHCDLKRAQASVCHLSSTKFKRLHPIHDASGKGLFPADVAAFAASLPVCGAGSKGR